MTPYQYTYQNPIRFTDPTGMEGESVSYPPKKGISYYVDSDGIFRWDPLKEKYEHYGNTSESLDTSTGFLGYYEIPNNAPMHQAVTIGQGEAPAQSKGTATSKILDYASNANGVPDGIGGSLVAMSKQNKKLYIGTARAGSPVNMVGIKFYGNGKTYLKSSYLGTAGRSITKVTGPVGYALSAGQIANGVYQDGGTFGYNAQKATLGVGGGMAGAWAGGILGAKAGGFLGGVVGSVVPGIGNAVGAGVGVFVGSLGGSIIGGYYGGEYAQKLLDLDF